VNVPIEEHCSGEKILSCLAPTPEQDLSINTYSYFVSASLVLFLSLLSTFSHHSLRFHETFPTLDFQTSALRIMAINNFWENPHSDENIPLGSYVERKMNAIDGETPESEPHHKRDAVKSLFHRGSLAVKNNAQKLIRSQSVCSQDPPRTKETPSTSYSAILESSFDNSEFWAASGARVDAFQSA
jgi:hypothetical protein